MDTERQYLDDEQAKRLYHNDQTFRQLVDCMVVLIHQLRLTPGEVRSAATFAAILHESRYPKSVYLPYDVLDEKTREQVLKAMQETAAGVRIPTPPPSPQKTTPPIGGVYSTEGSLTPTPCRCGCICHVCANGHDRGVHPHSINCRDRVLGPRLPRGWKEREA